MIKDTTFGGIWHNQYGVAVVKFCASCKHCDAMLGVDGTKVYYCKTKKTAVKKRAICNAWNAKPVYDNIGKADGHDLRKLDTEEIIRRITAGKGDGKDSRG